MTNAIAKYVRAEKIGPTELGRRLRISKGSACEIISGKRRVGPKVARRMEILTGRPWYEFVSPSPSGRAQKRPKPAASPRAGQHG